MSCTVYIVSVYTWKVYVYTECHSNWSLFVCVECWWFPLFLSSEVDFLVLVFCHGGPLSTVGFACALEWLNAIQVAVVDPGIVIYCLSSIEVLSLGFISLSSESLSDKYLL